MRFPAAEDFFEIDEAIPLRCALICSTADQQGELK
jgi:hypothetical protein